MQYSTDDEFSKIEGADEILVGNTNRAESATALEGLQENQFRIAYINKKIVINSTNPDCLLAAAQTFVNEFVTETEIKVPEDLNRVWQCQPGFNYYEVKNPILDGGSDPYVTQLDGTYYYCWSGGEGGGVMVSKAASIDKINYNGKQVVKAVPGTNWSSEYWAPELHYLNGEWYIYVAADDGEDKNHRMYVFKGTTQDPTDPFEMIGQITDPTDMWAIDGTVLQYKGEMYFVWSGWATPDSGGHQDLYIAHMSNPWTIDSDRVMISTPTNGWEGPLNEGPIPVYNGDDVYIVYSGNGSWTADYCLGYLKLTGDDPLKANSWEKYGSPILSRNSNAMGPGHCSVATAVDGSQWAIYHANPDVAGWDGRTVWIQKLQFSDNGKIKLMKNTKTVMYPEASWVVEKEIT